ncbi:RsmF rRNA methyltransferase first C-terminal domain-containing protein [Paenibacillus sp. JTLBN-2024]
MRKTEKGISWPCCAKRMTESGRESKNEPANRKTRAKNKAELAAYRDFAAWAAEELPGFVPPAGTPVLFGEALYLLPSTEPLPIDGLKVPRAGLHLAHLKKNRVEPAHALAMALAPEQAKQRLLLEADGPEAAAYLRGETLPVAADLPRLDARDGGRPSGGVGQSQRRAAEKSLSERTPPILIPKGTRSLTNERYLEGLSASLQGTFVLYIRYSIKTSSI